MILSAVLLVSGCRIDAAVDLRVDADGGGELVVTVGADADLVARAGRAGVEPLRELSTAVADGGSWVVEPVEKENGGRAVRLRTEFDNPEDLALLSEQLADGLAAAELAPPLEAFASEVGRRRLTVTGAASLVPTPVVRELGLTPDEAVARMGEAVAYRVTVTMPGEIVETTGARISPRSATWLVEAGGTENIVVVAERPWPTALLVGAGVAGLLLAVVLVWVLLRRRRRG